MSRKLLAENGPTRSSSDSRNVIFYPLASHYTTSDICIHYGVVISYRESTRLARECARAARYVTAPCENNEPLEHEACQDDAPAFYGSENNECLALSHAILRPYHLNKGSCPCLSHDTIRHAELTTSVRARQKFRA
ncbi:hypothetical protein DMN91_001831 [Ooceraea biroi]|uniref:Uncharacterized protein n=1 Tax=Ooceraea biroi TaxID=2015173 RepID=A0A3L8DZ04_OOCBI|nr:hypothetical protein DMN91_001831 [Ooceraea biroi]